VPFDIRSNFLDPIFREQELVESYWERGNKTNGTRYEKLYISDYIRAFGGCTIRRIPRVSSICFAPRPMNDTEDDGTIPGPNKQDASSNRSPSQEPTEATSTPVKVGRYRIRRRIGRGGFGEVYVGFDEQLQREVAIKLTYGGRIGAGAVRMFLEEARILAELDHPHIVPVFDIGTTEQSDLYIVSKLIDGSDLATRIENDRPSRELTLKIIAAIADALQYAHSKGLVHRDIKPANILLDKHDTPYLADFGIALRETDKASVGEITGTPAYMSPEQARGEGHLISNQSDIYSLGIVLYELLCGRRPFRSKSSMELLKQVQVADVRTPRLFDPTISRELESVCLKALARRSSDRYAIARDFAEEVRWLLTNRSDGGRLSNNIRTPSAGFLPSSPSDAGSGLAGFDGLRTDSFRTDSLLTPSTPSSGNRESDRKSIPVKVIPKGLRSFDEGDADFFLELLPGPYDRDGVPESLNFWRKRIEATDIERSFRVGLVYGPSGCGKSSLMKAGLLPRLSPKVQTVYVEATSDDTPERLLKGIEKELGELPARNLTDALALIRRKRLVPSGGKLLLVIDQFEQWLYASSSYADAELTNALRQCDGVTVQAIVMVREDFWVSVSRFLQELDIPIIERENSAMVDLFDMDHARKVFASFGRAYGKLPEYPTPWTEEQTAFINQAIEGLSEKEKVISVRLALLAEMMKGKMWTPKTLHALGGISGVGVTFLEETFGELHAPIQYRQHQEAVRAFLAALLPPIGTDIKGTTRTAQTLQMLCGYAGKTGQFSDLVKILNNDLKLITPVDEGGALLSYQLTHDYLVPSLREWLTRKQRETKKGRAELKLAERAAAWSLHKENKQLPTLLEWLQIRRLTEAVKWNASEKGVMQQATRHHLQSLLLAATAVILLAVGGWFTSRDIARQQEKTRVEGLVNALTSAEPSQVPEIIKQLDTDSELVAASLNRLLASDAATQEGHRARLRARMANVSRDSSLIEPLMEELLAGRLEYVLPIRQLLRPWASKLTASFQSLLQDSQVDPNRRFRAALALADYVSSFEETVWTDSVRSFVAQQLVSSNSDFQPQLREALRPIQGVILTDLERIFMDPKASDTQRLSAANALADYAAQDRSRLTYLLTEATPEQYRVLYPLVLAFKSPETITQLSQATNTSPPEDLGSVPRIAYGQRRANAAVTMLRLGERERVLPVFDWADDPEAMTQFIFRCKPRGISADELLDLLDITTDRIQGTSLSRNNTGRRSYNHARYALLLAIGEYGPSEIPAARLELLKKQLAEWYANDPSSGVHGASGWLLRHLGEKAIVDQVDQTPVPYSSDREWFTMAVTVQPVPMPKPEPEKNEDIQEPSQTPSPLPAKTFYYTFVVHPKGEYIIVSAEDEPERTKDELQHPVVLSRAFAMLDREITFEEMIAFSPLYLGYMHMFDAKPTDAAYGPDWYDSVKYCRWRGKEMGLPESEQCYADPESLSEDQYPRDKQVAWAPGNWPLKLDGGGFRLPTESEWEVAARCSARTSYSFGGEVSLLDRFCWFMNNSGKHVHPGRELRPTVLGCFDLHGNVFEWTHDWYGDFERSTRNNALGAKEGTDRVLRGGAWDLGAVRCLSSLRNRHVSSFRYINIGFRITMTVSDPDTPSINP